MNSPIREATRGPNGQRQTILGRGDLTVDAWGTSKTSIDHSLFHGMFSFTVPQANWKEELNGIEQPIASATSVNGKLRLAGSVGNIHTLSTYRHPRYEPNRGMHYGASLFFPSPEATGKRGFGLFTKEAGAFFRLLDGVLYAVVRTTVDSVTADRVERIEDVYLPKGLNLANGNIFDIQMQWRGVGNIYFYIGEPKDSLPQLVHCMQVINSSTELSIHNPALPIAFECEGDVVLESGCVDVSTEGGSGSAGTYGSISTTTESGQVQISGFNKLILAVRSLSTLGGLLNTRDVQNLALAGFSDQKSLLRVWATRDMTAVTENTATWQPFRDGNIEFIEPDATLDIAKAELQFTVRVPQDDTINSPALFDRITELFLTPGDMLVFTIHRENGGTSNSGVTYEFAEEI